MKLALICTEKLPVPPVAGGAVQLYIDGILPYLSQKHDVTVYCVKHPDLPFEEYKDNVRYVRVPGKSETLYAARVTEKLDGDFDLVHVFNRPRVVLQLQKEFPGLKYSLSLHNEMFHQEKISVEGGNRCIESVEFINTVSRYIADGVVKRFPQAEKKLRVVYSGADTNIYKVRSSPEGQENRKKLMMLYGLQEDCKVVLNVGRLSVKKGADVLLKAMKGLMETYPNLALVIVGSKWYGTNEEDDYVKSVKRLAKSLSGPVIFTGFVPPAEIPPYYNMGDVFVCTSQWNEPLARVHFEAMAAGLPIITSNRGGNPEVVKDGENGFVVDEYNNPDAYRRQIACLLDDPEAAEKMGMIGRRLAEEKYNWKRVADELLGVL